MKLKVNKQQSGSISIIKELDENEARERQSWLETNIAMIKRRIERDMVYLANLEQELAELNAVLPPKEPRGMLGT